MSKLSIGILGLPNVGKSTLFNAITNNSIEAENFPFCTIEPNKGIVPVPDQRLDTLSKLSNSTKVIPATIEFIDIAGLVKGASKGEGLGNKFLANVRECSALIHVVRCFDDDNVVHVDGDVNPIRDIQVINTELFLSDYDQCQTAIDNQKRKIKQNDKTELARHDILQQCLEALSQETPIRALNLSDTDYALIKEFNFLTTKKVIYVCNVGEDNLTEDNDYIAAVRAEAAKESAGVAKLSASFEFEVSSLDDDEKMEFLAEYGLNQSGLECLAQECYALLNLETFLTTGEKETRAWTITKGTLAPQAAGVIHTDFEAGFIRANVIDYDTFVKFGNYKEAKDKGALRQEGKDYVMKDGDIVEFLFNV